MVFGAGRLRYLKDLNHTRRISVQDAMFWWQINKQKKQQLLTELLSDPRLAEYTMLQAEAVQVIMDETRLSRRRCYALLDGEAGLEDFYGDDGRQKEGEK
jgi:hypothetical protein